MKITKNILYLLLIFSIKTHAVKEDYHSYLDSVLNNSESVKAKEALIKYEELNKLSRELYALPKISAAITPKNTKAKDKKYSETKLIVSSLIFDDTIFNSIKAQHCKLLSSILDLDKEKEKIVMTIMSNQINIALLEKLRDSALELKKESELLYSRINAKYNFGIVKESDVQLARLLMQKIDNETDNLSKEIEQLKLNIESDALYPYPKDGIIVESKQIERLLKYDGKENNIIDNYELRKLSLSKEEAIENAKMQDSMFSISLVAENKYYNSHMVKDDSYIGIKVSAQILDMDSKLAKSAGLENYRALTYDYDHKYKLLQNKVKLDELTSEANIREIDNLEKQIKTTKDLVKNQEREYDINQASVYEMLNTRFDLFQLEKSITGIKAAEARNKINLLQTYGKVLVFFIGDTPA